MLDFRTPALSDKERIEAFVRNSGQIGCDVSFVNTYLWRDHYDIRVAFDGDSYYKCYCMNGNVTGYAMPMTEGNIRTAVDKVIDDARQRGVQPLIGLLNDTNAELLQRMYGDAVSITEDRDEFDYIYEREQLALLGGKKYHAKRNHISRFMRTYENYSLKEISTSNLDDVLSVAESWQAQNDATGELSIIKEALAHFDALGLFGMLLYVDDRPVAMCLASAVNDSVCDVSFEKAVEIDEAYAVINQAFCQRFHQYTLVNREEDMGLEGLRKAKLSYHPAVLYTKSTAVFRAM